MFSFVIILTLFDVGLMVLVFLDCSYVVLRWVCKDDDKVCCFFLFGAWLI